MKTMKNFLSMTALALVGIVMTGCSSDDNTFSTPQSKNGLVLKTTVSLDGGASTRSLTAGGVKTFAVGEQVALFYKDENDKSRKVVSNALVAGDIANEGKTATLTFDLSANAPKSDGKYRLVYPASIAKDDIDEFDDVDDDWYTVKIPNLLEGQDGTIDNISSRLDLSISDGSFTSGQFSGSISLRNQLAILALTLKNGGSNISNLQEVFVCNAYGIYHFEPKNDPNDPIYVAIQPSPGSDENLEVYAKAGEYVYGKKMTTSKNYEKGHIYPISLALPKMNSITVSGDYDYSVYYNEGDKWEDAVEYLTGYAVNQYFGWITNGDKVGNYNEFGKYLYDSNNTQFVSKTDAINSSYSYGFKEE